MQDIILKMILRIKKCRMKFLYLRFNFLDKIYIKFENLCSRI